MVAFSEMERKMVRWDEGASENFIDFYKSFETVRKKMSQPVCSVDQCQPMN